MNKVLSAPSDMRIKWFCECYKVQLPDDYIGFLINNNGVIPTKNSFLHDGREYIIERFLCLLDKPREEEYGIYDLTVVLTQLDSRLIDDTDLVGMNIIPIAVLFAGDFVCLDFRSNKTPNVVVWYHEESDDFMPVTDKIAENFTDFLKILN